MKLKYLLFILSAFISIEASFAQSDSTQTFHIGKKYDTLKYYSLTLSDDGQGHYQADFHNISKAKYNKYQTAFKNIEKCTPCILKTVNENETLLTEGLQYEDCAVGVWYEYYPNGKIKVLGHFKENDSGNWDKLYERGLCSQREGTWTYYNDDGSIQKTEKYANNVLVK